MGADDFFDEPVAAASDPIVLGNKALLKRRKYMLLLALHMQNFQSMIQSNRRRQEQRRRRRQAMFQALFMQHMQIFETNFIETMMIPILCAVRNGTADVDLPEHISDDALKKMLPQSTCFTEYALIHLNEHDWLTTFRVSKKTFHWLCGQLGDDLKKRNNDVSTQKHVALAMYALATGDDYQSIASLFAVTVGSVAKLLKLFAFALLNKLGNCLLTMPKTNNEYEEIRNGFRQISNMPALVVGVLGVATVALTHQHANDNNILLQALVDDRMLFRKVVVESKTPTLYHQAPNEITMLRKQTINGVCFPCVVVASARYYPLNLWMMHRYEKPIAPHEYDFNEAIDNLLVVKEVALRRLFTRFKILGPQRKCYLKTSSMELLVRICCSLHNLCEETEENYLVEWEKEVDMTPVPSFKCRPSVSLSDTEDAVNMRDFLARIISSTEM